MLGEYVQLEVDSALRQSWCYGRAGVTAKLQTFPKHIKRLYATTAVNVRRRTKRFRGCRIGTPQAARGARRGAHAIGE